MFVHLSRGCQGMSQEVSWAVPGTQPSWGRGGQRLLLGLARACPGVRGHCQAGWAGNGSQLRGAVLCCSHCPHAPGPGFAFPAVLAAALPPLLPSILSSVSPSEGSGGHRCAPGEGTEGQHPVAASGCSLPQAPKSMRSFWKTSRNIHTCAWLQVTCCNTDIIPLAVTKKFYFKYPL